MSSYVFMKVLESAPNRYDFGIKLISLGKINRIYDKLAFMIKESDKILDIGCGTGALTLRFARKKAMVKGIDINSGMLDVAKKKVKQENLLNNAIFEEKGIVELDSEKDSYYDVISCGLVFSELSEEEINYGLKEIYRILKSDGSLIVVDEVIAKNIFKKMLNTLIKIPILIFTYIITQTTTHAMKNPLKLIESQGFKIYEYEFNRLENFMILKAKKKEN